jgi:hypothetical protein
MQVRYIGRHAAVRMTLPDGRTVVVARGQQLDVPTAHGRTLVRQATNWEAVKKDDKNEAEAEQPAAEKEVSH